MLDFADSQPVKSMRADLVAILAIAYSGWLLSLTAIAMMENTWARNTLVVVTVSILIGAAGWLNLLRFGRGHRIANGFVARAPYIAAGVFAATSLLEVLVLNPTGPFALLSHEKTFVAIYVLCMPRRRGARAIKVAMFAALMASLIAYPAATTVATLFAAAAISWLVRWNRLNIATMLMMCASLAVGFFFLQSMENALHDFYSAVGRTDNTQTRLFLWQQVFPYVQDHPWAGGEAKVSITALANINGVLRPTPLHNSFLTLLVVGGVVALCLLLTLVVVLTTTVVSRSASTPAAHIHQWLPPLVAGFGTFAVNPVIDNLASSLFFSVLILVGFSCAARTVEGRGTSVLPHGRSSPIHLARAHHRWKGGRCPEAS
jgi:O-antigen ligase